MGAMGAERSRQIRVCEPVARVPTGFRTSRIHGLKLVMDDIILTPSLPDCGATGATVSRSSRCGSGGVETKYIHHPPIFFIALALYPKFGPHVQVDSS